MPNVTTFDALLSGMTWNGVEVVGRPVFLTYSFDSAPAASLSQSFSTAFLSTFQAFNPNGQAVARTALQAWADACGVTFFEVPAGQGDIRFGVYDLAKGPPDVEDSVDFAFNPLVYAYPDGAVELDLGGDIFIQVGQLNFAALVHEIGHALGLKHPFEGLLTLEPSADNLKNTVMSYSPLGGPAIGLGVLDVQAATYLYGAATADGGQAASWSWDAHRSVLTQAGGPGADSLAGVATADRILGGAGADYIFTRAGDDSVDGGDGGDTVAGGDGSDTLSGAGGADLLDGGEGDDVVRGGEDDDRLWGLRGADTLMGETGDDTLQGGAGLNRLLGGSGNDVMVITSGASVVDGGDGDDALWLMPSTSASVTLSYASLTAGGGSYANVERIVFVGSSAADTLQGGELPDQMAAGDGPDSLSGGAADDQLFGESGNDTLAGGEGADRLDGGSGDDVILPGGGGDTCDGGTGADTVRGGQGADSLTGGAGADFLSGDKGDDTLAGGAGADVFHTFSDAGLDRVIDFSLAEGDRVMLDPGTQFTLSQVGADTVLSMTGGGQIVLVGVSMATLAPGWIFGA